MAARTLFLSAAALVLAADQATKLFMSTWLAPRGSVEVIPGLFDLTFVRNPGAVFGLLRGLSDPWRSLLLTAVPGAAILVVILVARFTPTSRRWPHVALGLVLGGALGNLVDRLRFGSVVDFLDFYVGRHHWPAFNVADSAICVGVAILLLDLWPVFDAKGNSPVPEPLSGATGGGGPTPSRPPSRDS